MVLLRESGMSQPAIAAAMGVSLSTVNRAHMAYDHGGIKALNRAAFSTQRPLSPMKRQCLSRRRTLRRPHWIETSSLGFSFTTVR